MPSKFGLQKSKPEPKLIQQRGGFRLAPYAVDQPGSNFSENEIECYNPMLVAETTKIKENYIVSPVESNQDQWTDFDNSKDLNARLRYSSLSTIN